MGVELHHEGLKRAMTKHKVSALVVVASDVSQRPDSLLAHILAG